MSLQMFLKPLAGREYALQDGPLAHKWLSGLIVKLRPLVRGPMTEVVLCGRSIAEVAQDLRIAESTVRWRLSLGKEVVRWFLMCLPAAKFDRLFRKVRDWEFSDQVTVPELTTALFGSYDRRTTQVITVKWIPQALELKLIWQDQPLPLPSKQGRNWVWSKVAAEIWRDWYLGEADDEEDEG